MWHGYEDNDDQDGHHDHDNDDHHHRDDQDFIEHLECGLEVFIRIIPRQGPTRSLLVIPDHCHHHHHHHHGDHHHRDYVGLPAYSHQSYSHQVRVYHYDED